MRQTEISHLKIRTHDEIKSQAVIWKFKGEKVVFTSGCFDLLHRGHIEFLSSAADMGNKLIVALYNDASVTAIKGNNRPLMDHDSRAQILAALRFVDAIVIFDESTSEELTKDVMPDILVAGGDIKEKDVAGYEGIIENGGQIKVIPRLEGFSSKSFIDKIRG